MNSKIYNELISLLSKYNLLADDKSTNEFNPISSELRESWYVDTAKRIGLKNAIHISTPYSFIAIVDGDKIMTGSNIFIKNALFCILQEFSDKYIDFPFFEFIESIYNNLNNKSSFEMYLHDGADEFILFTFDQFKSFLNSILNYINMNNLELYNEDNTVYEPF